MKLSIVLALNLYLVGCGLVSKKTTTDQLYSVYDRSKESSTDQQALYSPDLWETLQNSKAHSNKEGFAAALANYPFEMRNEISHSEVVDHDYGCLMVQGNNQDSIPMDYYLTFAKENNAWIINDITVKYYLDGTERYLSEPVCDEEVRMERWVEWMQSK
jgi:hypothetical protein